MLTRHKMQGRKAKEKRERRKEGWKGWKKERRGEEKRTIKCGVE